MNGDKPCLKLSAPGGLRLAAWRKQGRDGKPDWFSVKLSKSYKDDHGQWQDTSNLSDWDLPVACAMMQEAYARLKLRGNAPVEPAAGDRREEREYDDGDRPF